MERKRAARGKLQQRTFLLNPASLFSGFSPWIGLVECPLFLFFILISLLEQFFIKNPLYGTILHIFLLNLPRTNNITLCGLLWFFCLIHVPN